MRIQSTAFALTFVVLFLNAERSQGEEGKEFAPKNKMYTIMMPAGKNQSKLTRVIRIGRHKVPVEASGIVVEGGTRYLGASIGIPAVVMRDIPADGRFDTLRDAIVKGMNGKVVKESNIKKDEVPGKEYQVQQPNGVARVHLYTVAGFVLYATIEGKTNEEVNSKQADAFFKSLKLTEQAKEVFREVKR